MTYVLETQHLGLNFGALVANDNVSLALKEGEIRAVIGPNGAGKTTLFNLITGKLQPTSGMLKFLGRDVTSLPTYKRVKMGMGRSFQITNIFPRLSVIDNVLISLLARQGLTKNMLKPFDAYDKEAEEALELLKNVDLSNKACHATSSLSHGERRNLELGLTLGLAPKLILLDEPTAGMSMEETGSTVKLLRRVAKNMTVLFTEHDMDIVFSIADTISVLHQGQIIAEGLPSEVRDNKDVRAAYLGD